MPSSSPTTARPPALPSTLLPLLTDSHAHPADDPCTFLPASSSSPPSSPATDLASALTAHPLRTIVAMSTSPRDLPLLRALSASPLCAPPAPRVVPCFGLHPWFVHCVSRVPASAPAPTKHDHYSALFGAQDGWVAALPGLPDVVRLDEALRWVRDGLRANPAAMVGEVGLDRAFRIPSEAWSYHPSRRGAPMLTRLKTPVEHQRAVLAAQIEVALEERRNVSLHAVQAAGATVELLDALARREAHAFARVNVAVHSCTLDPQVVERLVATYPNVYVGVSEGVNAGRGGWERVVSAAGRERVLVESDGHEVEHMGSQVAEMARRVAEVWSGVGEQEMELLRDEYRSKGAAEGGEETRLERIWRSGVEQLASNWERFVRNGAAREEAEEEEESDGM